MCLPFLNKNNHIALEATAACPCQALSSNHPLPLFASVTQSYLRSWTECYSVKPPHVAFHPDCLNFSSTVSSLSLELYYFNIGVIYIPVIKMQGTWRSEVLPSFAPPVPDTLTWREQVLNKKLLSELLCLLKEDDLLWRMQAAPGWSLVWEGCLTMQLLLGAVS